MTATDIKQELLNRGYNAELHETVKNGVIFHGILIRTESDVAPIIYTDGIIHEAKTIEEAADKVLEINDANQNFPISTEVLNDIDWILEHITIAVQLSSNEPLEKKNTELEGIEQYLMLVNRTYEYGYSMKVTSDLLENAGISRETAWEEAEKHMCRDTRIVSLNSKIAEMLGNDADENTIPGMTLHIVSNSSYVKGASSILNREALSEYARELSVNKIVVLPSSIHEMIIMPFNSSVNLDNLSAMVKEINETQVLPEERLTDRAYVMEV